MRTKDYRRLVAAENCALRVLKNAEIEECTVELVCGVLHVQGIAPCFRSKQSASRMLTEALPDVPVLNEVRVASGTGFRSADVRRATGRHPSGRRARLTRAGGAGLL